VLSLEPPSNPEPDILPPKLRIASSSFSPFGLCANIEPNLRFERKLERLQTNQTAEKKTRF
jgi:hypothetical protein